MTRRYCDVDRLWLNNSLGHLCRWLCIENIELVVNEIIDIKLIYMFFIMLLWMGLILFSQVDVMEASRSGSDFGAGLTFYCHPILHCCGSLRSRQSIANSCAFISARIMHLVTFCCSSYSTVMTLKCLSLLITSTLVHLLWSNFFGCILFIFSRAKLGVNFRRSFSS